MKYCNRYKSTRLLLPSLIYSQADYVRAQYESKLSTLKLEVGALKREKADMEVKLHQQQIGAIAPDTARYVDQLQKEKAESNPKYISLRDRYDVSLSLTQYTFVVCISSDQYIIER